MQKNPLVSIVVPCYNMEKYLDRFIPLIIGQTYKNLDIVLVDDGSTDCTAGILDQFAAHDNRIRVIHQQNGGISCARQTGFQIMKGEYFASVDPDDTMEENYVEFLVETAIHEDADFVYCDYDEVYTDYTEPVVYPLNPLNPETYMKAQLAQNMWGTYWNKLIKVSLLKEHDVSPIPGVIIWEDYVVVNGCAAYANKLAYCPHVLYHYNQTNINSVTKQRSRHNLEQPITVLKHLEKHLQVSGMMPKIENEYQWQCLRSKRWMLDSEYRDFEAWRNLWPQLNEKELECSKGLYKMLVDQVIQHNDRIAVVIYYAIKVINKIKG